MTATLDAMHEYIEFANNNPVCFFATVEKNRPRVRALLLWYADESGFYFYTNSSKSLFKQLQDNPFVEVCFYEQGKSFLETKMLRISGRAAITDDEALKEQLFLQRPFLKNSSTDSRRRIKIVKIEKGEALFWTGGDWNKEKIPDPFNAKVNLHVIRNKIRGPLYSVERKSSALCMYDGEKHHYIKYLKIIYLSSHKKFTVIHTDEKDYEIPMLLKDLEGKLPTERFIRIHKQFLVNIHFLSRILSKGGGRCLVHLNDNDDTILPVGRKYASSLRLISSAGSFIP